MERRRPCQAGADAGVRRRSASPAPRACRAPAAGARRRGRPRSTDPRSNSSTAELLAGRQAVQPAADERADDADDDCGQAAALVGARDPARQSPGQEPDQPASRGCSWVGRLPVVCRAPRRRSTRRPFPGPVVGPRGGGGSCVRACTLRRAARAWAMPARPTARVRSSSRQGRGVSMRLSCASLPVMAPVSARGVTVWAARGGRVAPTATIGTEVLLRAGAGGDQWPRALTLDHLCEVEQQGVVVVAGRSPAGPPAGRRPCRRGSRWRGCRRCWRGW